MTLADAQALADRWIRDHGGYWDDFVLLARLTEELGEIAADLQRDRDYRPRKVHTDLAEEVGDLFFTLACFANKNDIDIEAAFRGVIRKYDARDSALWKERVERGTPDPEGAGTGGAATGGDDEGEKPPPAPGPEGREREG